MFRMQHQLKQQLGRDPVIEEVAEAMDISSEKIQQMSKDAQYTLYIVRENSANVQGRSIYLITRYANLVRK
jgi:DNA-directed RNA polymerase specialized sigma subunit